MSRRVRLGYGRTPLEVSVPEHAEIVEPAKVATSRHLDRCLRAALAEPVGALPLTGRVFEGETVAVVVSDATRDEPRAAMFAALRDAIGVSVRWRVAVANGTHAPRGPGGLGIGPRQGEQWEWKDHDGRGERFVDLGRTSRGTRVRFPRWLMEADRIVCLGSIRPHYFAGTSGGAKMLFPGLGHTEDIRQNHRLKSSPEARLGVLDDNPCRLDMEEAVALLGREVFALDVVVDGLGVPRDAVAGHVVAAQRAGSARGHIWWATGAEPADVVVVSDELPVTGSLYQASKLVAPAGWLLREGGTVILVAECPEGTGPVDVVNQGIYEIGLRHYLPPSHRVLLVSGLAEDEVRRTYCSPAASVESALAECPDGARVLVLPRGAHLVPRRAR